MSTLCVNDAELVEEARRGDASAFGELVERHRAAVYRTALVVCGSRPDAEEVAQDTFLAAWRSLDRFRGDSQFKTWVLAIAWKRALTRRRSVWNRIRRLADRPDSGFEPAARGPGAEERLIGSDFADCVARLVRTLPVKLRDPLLLAATGEWTFAEMAVALNVAEGTLKWRVMEARRRLKQKLSAMGYEVP